MNYQGGNILSSEKLEVKDLIEIAGKTALSAIPIGGTLITTVWDTVKSNAIARRYEEWKSLVEERLSKLEITLEGIGNNESFTSCLLRTTELAAKTSQERKREMLANALVNSLIIDIDENTMMIFLDLLSTYTEIHIIILGFFQRPTNFEPVIKSNMYMGSPITLFFETYPDLKKEEDLIRIIIKELFADGLLSSESMSGMMTADGAKAKRTTEFGDKFLKFISDDKNNQ